MNLAQNQTKIDLVTDLVDEDLDALSEATEEAIIDGNGFGWLQPPGRQTLANYWRGVLLVPERELYVARLAGRIVGTTQLLKPPANNEASAHAATLTTFFIAPWARGHGLAKGLIRAVARSAVEQGFHQIDLDVRETQTAAIALYEAEGFKRWGVKERYAYTNGRYVRGFYYTKDLKPHGKWRR